MIQRTYKCYQPPISQIKFRGKHTHHRAQIQTSGETTVLQFTSI